MKYCANCGNELMESMQFCPNCGTQVISTPNYSNILNSLSSTQPIHEKKHKSKLLFVLIFAIVLFILLGFLYYNARVTTYNQFLNLYNTMAEGSAKAENANILITKVWKNSILQIDNAETDKYTKVIDGNGQFYSDFNDALRNLLQSSEFINDRSEVYALQKRAETMVKDLAKHPKSFDEEYSDFKDCYYQFLKFTNMSLNPYGSLQSFTEEHNTLDKDISNKLSALRIYFDT